ncbi:MAG TPA: hypothetical protein VII06_09715 [Chloroflexota bacterium]
MATVYSQETKAAVLAAVLSGTPVLQAARQYGVTRAAARNWLRDLNPPEVVTPERSRDLGELLARYLTTSLRTLEAQARAVADPEYVKGQSAENLAILHGVLADKLIRILSAFESGAERIELDATAPPGASDS